MNKETCYYAEYGTCTNPGSGFTNKRCPGKECERFISENDYFLRSMAGERLDNTPQPDPKAREAKIRAALSTGKTKKQLKYEAKQKEAVEHPDGPGYTLADDPRFKDLFKKKQ